MAGQKHPILDHMVGEGTALLEPLEGPHQPRGSSRSRHTLRGLKAQEAPSRVLRAPRACRMEGGQVEAKVIARAKLMAKELGHLLIQV